jgi:hypothetical protein
MYIEITTSSHPSAALKFAGKLSSFEYESLHKRKKIMFVLLLALIL